jgi:tetratricopeptide (TPR) repeat protein
MMVDFPKSFALSPFRIFVRKRGWGALLAVLLLAGWGVWRLSLRSHSVEMTAVTAALEPAERALREAVLKAPQDMDARRAVGQYLLAERRPYEAMWAYQDALEHHPNDAEARRGLARALIMAQLPRRGLEVLATRPAASSALENPPSSASSNPKSKIQNPKSDEVEDRRVAAAAYLTQGDPMGAVTMLEAVGPALDGSPAALLDLGNAFEALGDDLSAGRAYQRLVQLQPENVEGQLALARVAARRQGWGVVFAALARAQSAAPGDPRPTYQMALALQAGGETRPAPGSDAPTDPVDLYRRLLQSHPDFGPAHLQLGLWYLRHGQPGAAVPSLERAVAARAGGEGTRLRLAEALDAVGQKAEAAFQRGRYDETIQEPQQAIQEYQRLAALDPGRKDVPLLLSAVYNQIDRNEQAAQVARQGFERDPEDLALRARYAMLLIMTDSRAQTAQLCRRWMKDRPNWGEPYFLLGRIEREALHPGEAVKLLDQALARDPRNADYCLESGTALMGERTPASLRAAAGRLRQALAIDPSNAEAHQLLGEVLERLGDLEGAAREYLRSMDHARSVRFGVYSLSRLCPRLKKMDRARFYAENVRVLREREDTLAALWRQVHRSPEDPAAHARLADLFLQAGDTQQALYQVQQAARLHPDPTKERQLQILRRLQAMREG